MTTNVKVSADCSEEKEVVIVHDGNKVVIQDGDDYEFVVYDNVTGVVFEQDKK